MLELQKSKDGYRYPINKHPVARVLKFRNVSRYFDNTPKGGKVLDYGSGDRPYEPFLKERFGSYIAGDHPEANKKHEARPDVYIVDERIDLDDDSVDCVLLTEVMEHIFRPAVALNEINRVLKPGGYVIASVPFAMREHEQPYDFYRYTSFAIRNLAADAGFEVIELDYVGDMVGVVASLILRMGQVVSRALRRVRLSPLAWCWNKVLRIPEYMYFLSLHTPLSPSRVAYFRTYPLGFTFMLQKPVPESGV